MKNDGRKMRFLVLTDSLSLPRKHNDEVVKYEDTYVSLLKDANPDIEFIHVGIGGATITTLYQLVKYYVFSNPDYVILQCGIVDCAPRALTEFELMFFGKLKLLRLILPFNKFLRKYRKVSYTKLNAFEKTLNKIKSDFGGVPLIGIGILPSQLGYELILPGITANIEKYNSVLKENTIYIDNHNFPKNGIINDFHHLSKEGHAEIFKKLQYLIKSESIK